MKWTIRDVAARAQVSPATVSNVLNGRGGVSDPVREHVLAVAEEMGYRLSRRPEPAVNHIRLLFCRTNGTMVNENTFFQRMIEGIQSECRRHDTELMINRLDTRQPEEFERQLEAFRQEACAGFILLATELSGEELRAFQGFASPLVVIDNALAEEGIHSVVIDNRAAGAMAARELFAAGCRSFGYLASTVPFPNHAQRKAGFLEELARLGIPTRESMIWAVSPVKSETREDMRRLLRQRKEVPDAFFAFNDGSAVSCVQALYEEGYRVPEDVSVLGMDDSGVCEYCTPPLSTLRVYPKEMGVQATRLLLACDGKAGEPPAVHISLGVSLVRRGSVRAGAGVSPDGEKDLSEKNSQ